MDYETADIVNEMIEINTNLRNLNAEIRDLRIVIEQLLYNGERRLRR